MIDRVARDDARLGPPCLCRGVVGGSSCGSPTLESPAVGLVVAQCPATDIACPGGVWRTAFGRAPVECRGSPAIEWVDELGGEILIGLPVPVAVCRGGASLRIVQWRSMFAFVLAAFIPNPDLGPDFFVPLFVSLPRVYEVFVLFLIVRRRSLARRAANRVC